MSLSDPAAVPDHRVTGRWGVCVLLLFGTMLNYMDRQALNQTSKRILGEFDLNKKQYGRIEAAWGYGFATGAVVVGVLVDRLGVGPVYPVLVFAWSAVGVLTGFVRDYEGLLACRYLLGVMEAGHYPCALRTTQHLLTPRERTMGNSLMHSGGAIGGVLTPLVVLLFVGWLGTTWRVPFLVIGGLGLFWVAAWLLLVPRAAHAPPLGPAGAGGSWADAAVEIVRGFLDVARDRRYWLLVLLVVIVNIPWHFFRAWLPLFLQEGHGYSEGQMQLFSAAYFAVADVGSLGGGFLTLWLARRGLTVFGARVAVFALGTAATLLSLAAAVLPRGPALLAVLLAIGFGSLMLFPVYYSFSQELTARNQGKLTGSLGCINWVAIALMQTFVGELIEHQGRYTEGVAAAGLPPLLGLTVLVFFWRRPAAGPPRKEGKTFLEPGSGTL
jgi:ACS family hexuronate transporter-like MFS transporter